MASGLSYGQMGTVKGKVFNKETGEAVFSANVYVKSGGNIIGSVVDPDGNFTIKPLSPGHYSVFVSCVGYDTVQLNNVVVIPDRITYLDNINLSRGIVLAVCTVTTPIIEKDKTSGVTIPYKIIDKLTEPGTLKTILTTMFSDITLSDNGKDLHFRGSRSNAGTYWVDGVRMRDSDIKLPRGSIGSMTVYTGGIPAKYGDCTGGVVIIQTRSYFDWLAAQY